MVAIGVLKEISVGDSALITTARDWQILEALALLAAGVSKTARDVTERQKQLVTGK